MCADVHSEEPSLLLVLKWGGELTPAGRVQAEELGRTFRCMYPGGQGKSATPHSAERESVPLRLYIYIYNYIYSMSLKIHRMSLLHFILVHNTGCKKICALEKQNIAPRIPVRSTYWRYLSVTLKRFIHLKNGTIQPDT